MVANISEKAKHIKSFISAFELPCAIGIGCTLSISACLLLASYDIGTSYTNLVYILSQLGISIVVPLTMVMYKLIKSANKRIYEVSLLEASHQELVNNLNLFAKNVSAIELTRVIQLLNHFETQIENAGQILDLNQDNHVNLFLQYLKQGCKIDALLTLNRLGADKEDCHIDVFAKVDAHEADVKFCKKVPSLQWLALNAIDKHNITPQSSKMPEKVKEQITKIPAIRKYMKV